MAAREPALLDASFTAHDQHVPPALSARLSGGRPLAAPVGFAAMSGWRYLLAIDGHGWQVRVRCGVHTRGAASRVRLPRRHTQAAA